MQKIKSSFIAVFAGNATNRQFIDVFATILLALTIIIGLLYILI